MVLPGFYFEILHLFNLPLSSGVTEVILAFFGNVYWVKEWFFAVVGVQLLCQTTL